MEKIIFNGKIYIEKGVFVQALHIKDGFIKAAGTDEEIRAQAGPEAVFIDAEARTILPGFIDSHLHLLNVGLKLVLPKLEQAKNIDELVEIGQDFIRDNPQMVEDGLLARGWNQDLFVGDKRMPLRQDLDRVSRDIPLVFTRVCGHQATANTKALEMAGLFDDLPQIEGGQIQLDDKGLPNGVLLEGPAINYVASLIPGFSLEDQEKLYLAAVDYALSQGLTTVHSTDARDRNYKEIFPLLRRLRNDGQLKMRFRHQFTLTEMDNFQDFLETEFLRDDYDDLLALGPLKLYKDGSLGARTALLKEDYKDEPGNRGLEVLSNKRTDELVSLAHDKGIQVVTHVIGDEASERTLDSYEKVMDGANKYRHSLVHTQITDSPLLERIASLDVPCLVQPIFLDYDSQIAKSRVGKELASTSYAFKTMLNLGIVTAYGTDAPIEDLKTFENIYSAVSRKRLEGDGGAFYPQERVSIEEAIDSYSLAGAYVEFNEDRKGRLKPGYMADLIILDRDIFTVPVEEIKNIQVDMTMVDGKVVYKR